MNRLCRAVAFAAAIVLLLASPPAQPASISAPAQEATITLQDIDSGLTSPTGSYRWLDVANQPYSGAYQTGYDYTQASVEVTYEPVGATLSGTLTASNLKPNFAYQFKLAGYPGTLQNPRLDNERVGLAGRWWQQEWLGTDWSAGGNLNDRGDGSSPNPNDVVYIATRGTEDPTSDTGLHYKYTGYLVFDYFITNQSGNATLPFETNSSYHVLWATPDSDGNDGIGHSARDAAKDGPLKDSTFDADLSAAYPDSGGDDYAPQWVAIFGEWERLPVGGVTPQPGDYVVQMFLTEESFHGSGGGLSGNWAAAMGAEIPFSVTPAAPALAIDISSGDVVLSWDAIDHALEYSVYRDTAPYFTPSAGSLLTTTLELSYPDSGALADPSNLYYAVTAVAGSGPESAPSGRVGKFGFALVPGGD